ncbi:twin arginine-targeting protein translocase TatC [Boudabousia tangfeifanii]|uniref:Sec-independent protein translocase protein TatC n=1 Tax=Boudabousia tangfeifanii TaxID=1912795 RepID=A0A1D9MME7_9ACTO|nr:twin arginine-targeting protein translocase TatC [Boudabousia tangfeifanii]
MLEHLAEARRRLLWALGGIVVASIAGWFLTDWLLALITNGFQSGQSLNFVTVGGAFDLRVRLAFWAGFILSAPWWLAQIWLFLAPGLRRREQVYLASFALASLLLFSGGAAFGVWMAPRAVAILTEFAPSGSTTLLTAASYVTFYTRLVLLFGLSGLFPVILVALNFLGILSSRVMLKGWRVVTLLVFVFAAIANPLPSPWSMTVQALVLMALYFLAIGIAKLRERSLAKQLGV